MTQLIIRTLKVMTSQRNGEKPEAEAAVGGMAVADAGDGRAPALPWSSGCLVRLPRDETSPLCEGREAHPRWWHSVGEGAEMRSEGAVGSVGQRALGPGAVGLWPAGEGQICVPRAVRCRARPEWSDFGFRKMSLDAERGVGVGTGRGEM